MKNSFALSLPFRAARVGVFASMLLAAVLALSGAASPAVKEVTLSEPQLQGTWVLVGTPSAIGEVPARGGTLMIRSGGRWTEVEVSPRSGLVQKVSGGTYRFNGNDYEETVDYGSDNVADWMGKTYRWKVAIEGDSLTRIGLGNPWTHVWKRVK